MKQSIDAFLAHVLARWVDAVDRRPGLVSATTLLVTVALGAYAYFNLAVNSDNMSLISDQLPSKQAQAAFDRLFPNLEEAMFVVVDAQTPELARDSATRLAEHMSAEPEHFTDVYLPGGGDFFERNGLLYRSADELDDFADEMARIQPLVASLERDPSIANMAELVELGLDAHEGENDQWPLVLDRISDATVAIYTEYPLAVSWEELLLQGSSIELSTRRAIVVHPVLDYSDILVARRPIRRVRELAEELGLVEEQGVVVRITGNPALNYDEMVGLAWDVGGAGVFCFLLVAFILYLALRSMWLVVAALTTLLTGLVWTGAYATLAVGSLNLLTISFAVLFLGLGVDFGIHLGMGYADCLRRGQAHREAMRSTAAHVGGSLFFCTITTSIGFFAFAPSQFRGLAELGVIAGGSMFIIFFLTLTLFPALVGSWMKVDTRKSLRAEVRFGEGWWTRAGAHPRTIVWVASILGIGSLFLLPATRLDSNVVEMRDPDTESVQAFHDLLAQSGTSPWYLDSLSPDLDSAIAIAQEFEALDSVDMALTLDGFVPDGQEEKMEVLADIAFLFEKPPPAVGDAEEPTADEQVAALRRLRDYLPTSEMATASQRTPEARAPSPIEGSMLRLREHLDSLIERVEREGEPENALADFERVLLASLPNQLARLRKSLEPDPISLESLPAGLASRMRAADGTARIQVFPSGDMRQLEELRGFVRDVKAVDANASGVPINLVEFGRVTEVSFIQAIALAVLAISILLWVLWRRLSDVVLVMSVLFLGASLTGATMVLLGITFNFANTIVIPLLFGIGVDSGIHLIQEARENPHGESDLLGTSTARAVFYSALTTLFSFGSMSLAGHNGLATLGVSLIIGLLFTVPSVLFVLPALMKIRGDELSPDE